MCKVQPTLAIRANYHLRTVICCAEISFHFCVCHNGTCGYLRLLPTLSESRSHLKLSPPSSGSSRCLSCPTNFPCPSYITYVNQRAEFALNFTLSSRPHWYSLKHSQPLLKQLLTPFNLNLMRYFMVFSYLLWRRNCRVQRGVEIETTEVI